MKLITEIFRIDLIELKCIQQLELSWNKLDTLIIEDILADEIIYVSQWVLSEIKGKSEVLKFLERKFKTIRKQMKKRFNPLNAIIGFLPSMDMRPCILLNQLKDDNLIKVTILIEVKDSLISKIEMCFIPNPAEIFIGIPNYKGNKNFT